ncbi:pentatricopeptide repeat-containing protein At1g55890, mitochondrial-like [Prosopis cineraria]|uniref:pentatricopeptide repeat-containing protein At1g55890, mitochondrial-like n=1 Tax=Prosopis cineraria TaxID=364024 RepID=UPI00240F9782|nr:pentatricopeptide repeat-containing protein At1g55890, mitochondrial-like [Prosopis cineraria]XP_054803480.1 pentatricopeptide repeat-containing protein At1g55890, mitochondrial-like [Prosopis cineraria]
MSSLCRLLQRNFSSSAGAAPSIRSLVKKLYKERDYNLLVQKFKDASEVDRFRTKDGIYELTVRRLASAKQFNLVEEILEDQKRYKDISREGFSARLIRLYGLSGMFENAHKLFDGLPERNCTRTVLSFNALLSAYLHSKKFDMVDRLFKELPAKLSVEPNLVSYNTVIKAFCEMDSFDSAIAMLDEMEKKGVIPDLITFNTLLHGLYVNGRFSDGDKIWSLMGRKDVIPDIRSYNAKLEGLVGQKNMKEAVELIEKMRDDGVKPDIYSINALIKGFVNEKNLDEVKKWYREIANSDYNPNNTTFKLLIPFLCENGDLYSAYKVSKDIFECRNYVEASIPQLVVDKLAEKRRILEVKKMVKLGSRFKLSLPQEK